MSYIIFDSDQKNKLNHEEAKFWTQSLRQTQDKFTQIIMISEFKVRVLVITQPIN